VTPTSLMRNRGRVRVAIILMAPVLFWILATGIDVARRDPEAGEPWLTILGGGVVWARTFVVGHVGGWIDLIIRGRDPNLD